MVPSFNHEAFVIELLDSIKSDSVDFNEAAELVIFDDGSLDHSPTLIRDWEEKNRQSLSIKVVCSPTNRGIPYALNRLIEMSAGKFVRLCGTDDVLIRGSTKKMLERFSSRAELICVFGDAIVIDETGNTINRSSIAYHSASAAKLSDPGQVANELINHWCIAGPSMVLRRSHYENMRYDESLKIDDFDLILSLLEKDRAVEFIDEAVCLYRIHQTNTSKTKNTNKRIQNLTSFLHIVERYIERGSLKNALLPLRYRTRAKLNFLKREYVACALNLIRSKYFARTSRPKE